MPQRQTLESARTILASVTYRDWRIALEVKSSLWFLRVTFNSPDADGAAASLQQHGRSWYVSPWATDSEIVQTAFLAIKTAEEHELREAFLFRGKRVFGPHFDLNYLAAVADDALDVRTPPPNQMEVPSGR